ncbi:hypothetical protein KY290_027319 [Solanum tuberosum]|uniref:Uncharacterized protein n=1 Tax=Solanum tuberosum TaxID=4113 RepID=A0ABQ7UGF5_SOLTU|nr:hypothetical protein KY290_027319 [Solanum tuberosum]
MGITHSYELGNAQTRRRWKDNSTIFPKAPMISWSSKKQRVVTRSSREAGYRAIASTSTESVLAISTMAKSQLLYKASANTGFHGDAEFGAFESEEISLESFPCVNVESLQYLNLVFCHSLEKFPEILGRMKLEGNTVIYYSVPSSSYITRIEFYVKPCSSAQQHWHVERIGELSCGTLLKPCSSSTKHLHVERINEAKCVTLLKTCSSSKQNWHVERIGEPTCVTLLKPCSSSKQHLHVERIGEAKSLPSSIGMLKGLVNLNVSFCSKLETLPGEIGDLGNLEKLDVSWCSKLERLTEEIGDLDNFVKLKASYTQISQPPFSIVQLDKLIFLSFERQCLEDGVYFVFPQVDGGLRSLQILDLSFCNIIDEGLPEDIGSLSSLKEFHLSGNNFEHLPGSITQLVALKTLYLSSCERFLVTKSASELGEEYPKLVPPSGI